MSVPLMLPGQCPRIETVPEIARSSARRTRLRDTRPEAVRVYQLHGSNALNLYGESYAVRRPAAAPVPARVPAYAERRQGMRIPCAPRDGNVKRLAVRRAFMSAAYRVVSVQ